MEPTLDGMQVLDAIARGGSFGSAAKQLHRSQPAISYAVQQLEDALGVQIFDRSGWRASFTPQGLVVLAEARRVLAALGRLRAAVAGIERGWEARLVVVVDAVLPLDPLLAFVAELDRDDAPTAITIVTATLAGVERQFDAIDADLMIAASLSNRSDLLRWPLPPWEMVMTAAPAHPLASRASIARNELANAREILVYDAGGKGPLAAQFALGATRQVLVADFHTKRRAIEQGIGIGWLPRPLIADALASGALVQLDCQDGATFSLPLTIACRADRPLGLAGRALRERLTRDGFFPAAASGATLAEASAGDAAG